MTRYAIAIVLVATLASSTFAQPQLRKGLPYAPPSQQPFAGLEARVQIDPVKISGDASRQVSDYVAYQERIQAWRDEATAAAKAKGETHVVGFWRPPVEHVGPAVRQPPMTRVTMYLELKNLTTEPIQVNDDFTSNSAALGIEVTGPQAVLSTRPMLCVTVVKQPRMVTIQPNETHRIRINGLKVGLTSHWSIGKPGTYEMTVKFSNGHMWSGQRILTAKARFDVTVQREISSTDKNSL